MTNTIITIGIIEVIIIIISVALTILFVKADMNYGTKEHKAFNKIPLVFTVMMGILHVAVFLVDKI